MIRIRWALALGLCLMLAVPASPAEGTVLLRAAGAGVESSIPRLLDAKMSLDQHIREADQAERLRETEGGQPSPETEPGKRCPPCYFCPQ